MPQELKIENWKYGLDARRDDLVSQPGTLISINNGHINPGGEIESRLEFVKAVTNFGNKTFGLQDTSSGIFTFGSATGVGTGVPAGVTYQRLTNPYQLGDVMNGAVYTCAFRGKPFVIASFTSGAVFAFYNGVVVKQITTGLVNFVGVGNPETPGVLSTDLAGAVNSITGWLAHANVINTAPSDVVNGYNETALTGSVLVMSPVGVHFTPAVANNNSVAGLLGVRLIDQNFPGIPAKAALVTFTINAGTAGTIDAQAPFPLSGSSSTSLFQGPLTIIASSSGAIATTLATAINNFTFLTGYSAIVASNGIAVTVYAPTSYGVFTSNLTIVTTGDITTVTGGPVGQGLTIQLNPGTVQATVSVPTSTPSTVVGITVSASATGQAGAVTFKWLPLTGGTLDVNGNGLVVASCDGHTYTSIITPAVSVTGPNCSFVAGVPRNTTVIATFRCTATDGTSTVSIDFTVKLTCKTTA